ncbi:M48 family metallopeptidase [Hallella multisaccharivorax]|uniref:Peptidase M48 Ste24p n=1 Tax=Hallella multisaccharivorax DSM 17128 TaxID=688246 RepID=F8N9S4_9BACT|nr:M48 family metallopeptidase [Hallella multisaccharivorax]EGN56716.1 peptidase M48 Ste24p [Hallella multisaccharivorax DSM 17128]
MRHLKLILMSAVTALLFAACGTTSTVPITGRKHTLLLSDAEVLSLSNQQYSEFMKSAKVSTNAQNTAMVKRVGQRLANAVETFLRNNGMSSEIRNYAWEFNLIQNQEANAFCMPGGKIVVYEGLLPITKDEASLAIVLGHEIAHAVAKHSAEQISKKIRQQYGTQIGGALLGQVVGSNAASIATQIAQTGFSLANLKYSRNDESEADHMGLIFAAMAGYNPEAAIPFWQRMSQSNSNQSDFLSDHPSDAKRIAALRKEIPEAMKYYEASGYAPKTMSSKTITKRTSTKRTSTKRRK